jgi:hypothetical protein
VIVRESARFAAGSFVAFHVLVTEFFRMYVMIVAVAVLTSCSCPASAWDP